MPSPNIITGARARVSINGQRVGYATGVNLREQIAYEKLDVLDNIRTEEFVPVGYEVSGTADYVRVVFKSEKGEGWFPKTGKTPSDHLTNILNQGDLTFDIQDMVTGKIVAQMVGVKMSETNMQIGARAIVGKNVTFVGKFINDEADIAAQ